MGALVHQALDGTLKLAGHAVRSEPDMYKIQDSTGRLIINLHFQQRAAVLLAAGPFLPLASFVRWPSSSQGALHLQWRHYVLSHVAVRPLEFAVVLVFLFLLAVRLVCALSHASDQLYAALPFRPKTILDPEHDIWFLETPTCSFFRSAAINALGLVVADMVVLRLELEEEG